MIRLIKLALWVLASYKWGHWRDWRKYYPTILFSIMGELIYFTLTYNHPLWEAVSPSMNITFNHLLIDLIAFPAIGLLLLSNFPAKKNYLKRGLYLILWIIGAVATEGLMFLFGYYKYSNGWSLLLSAAFDSVLIPLIVIHQKYPPLAWVIGTILGTSIFLYFNIPVGSMK